MPIGELDMSQCKRCGAAIVWLKTLKGANMPVNANTVKEGDYYFRRDRHMPHWATCPDAAEFRKKKETDADKDESGSRSAPAETGGEGTHQTPEVPRAVLVRGTPSRGKTREAAALHDKARAGVFVDPRSAEAGR
jgi:hypothetical protein